MKKLFAIALLLFAFGIKNYAEPILKDSLTRKQFIHLQTVKADTLNQLALGLATPKASLKDLNQAIEYIMKGLHMYSKYRDSTGLRQTFDHLGLVYHLQKKYVQAKWFYIQSNSLSRELNDTANIIHSLIALSSVKTDIKDYEMASKDLHEALNIAKSQPGIDAQIEVEQASNQYYTKKGDAARASIALNRIIFLKDSVTKHNDQQKQALLQQQNKQKAVLQQKNEALKT